MNYQAEKIDFKGTLPLEVFKTIRFQNAYPDRFTGHLRYVREYYKGYDHAAGDVLDEKILAAFKSRFENAFFSINDLILSQQQVQTYLTVTRGGAEKDILFYFMPLADYDTYQALSEAGELFSYHLNLKATLWLNEDDGRMAFVPSELRVLVPFQELKELITTIKSSAS